MVCVFLIFSGFLMLMIAELLAFRAGRPPSGGILLLQMAGYATVTAGIVLALLSGGGSTWLFPAEAEYFLPAGGAGAIRLGLTLAGVAATAGLIWTVLLEIPLARLRKHAASPKATGDGMAPAVYRQGSYGRCRHPGFWWFLAATILLALAAGRWTALAVMIFANSMNLLLIFIQDRYTFPQQFSDYETYRKEVPFLLPQRYPEQHRTERSKHGI